MELEFWVTINLENGSNGDVAVTVEVSDKEYELLKQCCRDDEDIENFDGLEDLYDRIVDAAMEESECCEPDGEDDFDYDELSCTVAIPDAIVDEVQEEE